MRKKRQLLWFEAEASYFKKIKGDVAVRLCLSCSASTFSGDFCELLLSILRGYADKFEQIGIDEAFLDVSQKVDNYEEAKELARKMKGEILEKERLKCSVGIGPNKLIVKIARRF